MGTFQKQIFYVSHGARSLIDHYLFLIDVKKENEKLQKEVLELRANLVGTKEIRLENERLRDLLKFIEKTKYKYIPAKVIAFDVSSDHKSLRIDRGQRDGIKIGMGVVTSYGVVGRILRATPNYSDVLTLIDPTSRIDALVQRSRVKGIVFGEGRDELTCVLKYIDKLEDIVVGDIIEASGFNSIFPSGLKIGTVTNVTTEDNSIVKKVILKSSVDIYRLEEVLVVSGTDSEKATE